jgi:serine protease Do
MNISVKLAERPQREKRAGTNEGQAPQPSSQRGPALGLSVRDLDRDFSERFKLPAGMHGVIISRVEPMSPAFDAEIERGHVLLEVNRHPVRSVDDYRRPYALCVQTGKRSARIAHGEGGVAAAAPRSHRRTADASAPR